MLKDNNYPINYQSELTLEQIAAQIDHLRVCESGRKLAAAWEQVEEQFSKKYPVFPEPGFTFRWQKRVEIERERLHHRQTLLFLSLSIAGTLILITGGIIYVWPWIRVPNLIFWTVLYQLYAYLLFVQETGGFLMTVFSSIARVIPMVVWLFMAGFFSQLGVLWIVAYRLLTNPRSATR